MVIMIDLHGIIVSGNIFNKPNKAYCMVTLSIQDRLILIQYALEKYSSERILLEKLKDYLSTKELESAIDTLIATQEIKRIGPEMLQNNLSHTHGLPELPEHLQIILKNI
jgi:hypothetical protein